MFSSQNCIETASETYKNSGSSHIVDTKKKAGKQVVTRVYRDGPARNRYNGITYFSIDRNVENMSVLVSKFKLNTNVHIINIPILIVT